VPREGGEKVETDIRPFLNDIPQADLDVLLGFQRQIFAALRSLFTEQKLLGLISKEHQQDLLTLKVMTEAGKLTPVIDRTYPLSEAPQAIRYLEQGHARGKVVLSVSK
jgi:NADPH:quinone reductase-like Zn-dependent oxidoreductase